MKNNIPYENNKYKYVINIDKHDLMYGEAPQIDKSDNWSIFPEMKHSRGYKGPSAIRFLMKVYNNNIQLPIIIKSKYDMYILSYQFFNPKDGSKLLLKEADLLKG